MKLYDGAAGWVASTFDAMAQANNTISQRESQRTAAGSIVNGRVSNGFFGMGAQEYSVVGMNATKIPSVRETIRNYVNEIMNHLNQIEPLANADNAFRSEEVQQSVSNYIATVKEYCVNLTSQLLAFSDKLADVEKAYHQNMERLSGNVNQQSNAFGDSQKYQETIQ